MPMQDDHDDISRLLRLKRFEQPEPEYFQNFLQEFKERQRAQLLREPAWRIAWDRLGAFFGEQFPVRMGYGLASTAVLVAAAITSFNILESRPIEVVASAPVVQQQQQTAQAAPLDLNSQLRVPELPSIDGNTAQAASLSTPRYDSAPRYIMDARPVSYEPPSSF